MVIYPIKYYELFVIHSNRHTNFEFTLKYWSASSIISGSLESRGSEGTGPLTEHLMGNRATFPTLSTPLHCAAEWYAGMVLRLSQNKDFRYLRIH